VLSAVRGAIAAGDIPCNYDSGPRPGRLRSARELDKWWNLTSVNWNRLIVWLRWLDGLRQGRSELFAAL